MRLAALALILSGCAASLSQADQEAVQRAYLEAQGRSASDIAAAEARAARLDSLRIADPSAYAAESGRAAPGAADEAVDEQLALLRNIDRNAKSAATTSAIHLGLTIVGIILSVVAIASVNGDSPAQ